MIKMQGSLAFFFAFSNQIFSEVVERSARSSAGRDAALKNKYINK